MLRSAAACTSIAAFTGPVEAIILSPGSRSITLRDNGVRSRMAHTTSNGRSRCTTASGSLRWSVNTVISARSATLDQSAMPSAALVVVE
jgi:hypothetical protein